MNLNWKKIFAVVRREYVERIRTRAFWIGTLLFPGLFIGLIGFQIVLTRKAGGERHLAVVDATGSLYTPLKAELEALEKERQVKRPNEKAAHWVLTQRPVEGDLEQRLGITSGWARLAAQFCPGARPLESVAKNCATSSRCPASSSDLATT